jgi:2-oxoglutarate/2-oxoacid ferredoxin oxidoreductase subunit beta
MQEQKAKELKRIAGRPICMTDQQFHYCPGCSHGVIHRIIGEVIDEMQLKERTLGVAPVGCSVFAYWYYKFDFTQAAHGRAPAVATGAKRARPEMIVFTYQGDGDLAAIGTAEMIHSANRGEKISVIFVNNAIYGMTGGQMAPTSLVGQKTATSPYGRNPDDVGYPIRVSELIKDLRGVKYVARTAVDTAANVLKTKQAIKNALTCQLNNLGFSLVEVVSTCPTNWGLSPLEANKWMVENMFPYFQLGEIKNELGEVAK